MDKSIILSEIKFKAVRASGAGGQHVNKVSTKVELTFDIQKSMAFSDEEKERILHKLKNKASKEGTLVVHSQDSRSQLKNKKDALSKLFKLLSNALIVPKKRKRTLPSKKVKEKKTPIQKEAIREESLARKGGLLKILRSIPRSNSKKVLKN